MSAHDWFSPDPETVACRNCGIDYIATLLDSDCKHCPAARHPVKREPDGEDR